jgi:hypothetical protein
MSTDKLKYERLSNFNKEDDNEMPIIKRPDKSIMIIGMPKFHSGASICRHYTYDCFYTVHIYHGFLINRLIWCLLSSLQLKIKNIKDFYGIL